MAAQLAGHWTATTVESRLCEAVLQTHQPDGGPLDWVGWLEPEDAALVRARAQGARWKLICWRFGISRVTAYRRWRYALAVIAWRLNGHPVPVGQSRRQFLKQVGAAGL